MHSKVMNSDAVRSGWRDVIENVMAGGTIVVKRYKKPVAAVIPYADFVALREQLEDLYDVRAADAAYAEYKRDPSTAIPIEDAIAEWEARDAAQAENPSDE